MAVTLPHMGLVQWNQTTDNFSHTDLANNFLALDNHDHSSGKGVQIGTPGIQPGSITNALLAPNSVDNTKIVTGAITPASLASPMNRVYRVVEITRAMVTNTQNGAAAQVYGFTPGAAPIWSGTQSPNPLDTIYINPNDFAVNGLSTYLSVRGNVATGTNPNSTITIGLYPITSVAAGGTANNIIYTFGAALASSTVAIAATAAGQLYTGVSADFPVPAAGVYALGFTLSATPAGPASVVARLAVRNY